MKFDNIDSLQLKDDFEFVKPYLEVLSEHIKIFSNLDRNSLGQYGLSITIANKYAFSSKPKEIYYGGLNSRADVAYNFNKDGSISSLIVACPELIDSITGNGFYDQIQITPSVAYFRFNGNTFVVINYYFKDNDIFVHTYNANPDLFPNIQ